MIFKLICVGFSLVKLFLVVETSRIEKEHKPLDISEIADNITSVQNVLHNVLKNYKKLEQIANTQSLEDDDKRKSFKSNENIDKIASNEGKPKRKVTTKAQPLKGMPLFFSDKSSNEDVNDSDKDSGKKVMSDVRKKNRNTRITVKRSKQHKPKEPSIKVTNNKPKLRNTNDETEASEDKNPLRENIKDDMNDKEDPKNEGLLKFIKLHVSEGKTTLKNRVTTRQKSKLDKSNEKSQISKSKEGIDDSQSQEEKAMERKVLRAGHLRQAYVDACKQVIIRKCYRALRAVSKDVCSKSRKCNSKYKDAFRENGQAACDEQFNVQTSACRMGAEMGEPTGEDQETEKQQPTDIKKPTKTAKHSDMKEENILRDRFENICRKTSFDKCRVACKTASEKTCDKHDCSKAKKKALKTSCKRRCKEIFKYRGGDSDESGNDDDDDEDNA